jgi:hypothetical protein
LKIRHEFEEAKQTRKMAEPRPEDIQAVGWAKAGNKNCTHYQDTSSKSLIK